MVENQFKLGHKSKYRLSQMLYLGQIEWTVKSCKAKWLYEGVDMALVKLAAIKAIWRKRIYSGAVSLTKSSSFRMDILIVGQPM